MRTPQTMFRDLYRNGQVRPNKDRPPAIKEAPRFRAFEIIDACARVGISPRTFCSMLGVTYCAWRDWTTPRDNRPFVKINSTPGQVLSALRRALEEGREPGDLGPRIEQALHWSGDGTRALHVLLDWIYSAR